MPLEISPQAVARLDGRAQYRSLADAIRHEIDVGRLGRGESLPSEHDLAEQVGVSRATVRAAIKALVAEGLVATRAGMPSRVTLPPMVRRMSSQRYREEQDILQRLGAGEDHPLTSAFTVDHAIEWSAYRVDVVGGVYSEEVATPIEVAMLDLSTGERVLRRRLVKYRNDVPVQLQDSVMPLDLARDTPVADPARQPWPGGTMAELHSIGLLVAMVSEDVRSRMPTPQERVSLQMDAVGPVFDIVRVFSSAEERPVEASIVVCSAAGTVLAYETDLT
jgi:GntR family transcriptional regulator